MDENFYYGKSMLHPARFEGEDWEAYKKRKRESKIFIKNRVLEIIPPKQKKHGK